MHMNNYKKLRLDIIKYLLVLLMFGLFGCSSTSKNVSLNNTYDANNKIGWINENTFRANAIGYPRLDGDSAEIEAYEAAYELGISKIVQAFIKEININDADNAKSYNEILEDDKKLSMLINAIKNDVRVYSGKYNGKYSEVVLNVHKKDLRKDLNENRYIIVSLD